MQKKTERLANTTGAKTKRELRKQITKLQKTYDQARADAAQFRTELKPVMQDLSSARGHLAHALKLDTAMANIKKELEKRGAGKKKKKAAKKKTAGKKAPAKKTVKKKAAKKKAAKKTTKKKTASRKKTA